MPRTAQPVSVAAMAEFLGLSVEGESDLLISGFASLGAAAPDEIVFLRDAGHRVALDRSAARVVLAPPGVSVGPRTVLRSDRPAHDFARLLEHFAPSPRPAPGVSAQAFVDPTAKVAPTASVAAGCVVGAHSRIGERTILAGNVTVGAGVVVGDDCRIHANVSLQDETEVGDRVVLQPGVVLGGDGFGLVADAAGKPVAMPQRGRVVLEDDVEIGANTTVDRATLDETRIRRGAKIDNLVQIAHNCDIGEGAIIVAQSGLSGGTIVGRGAIVMAQAGTTGHLTIGDGAFVGARAGLHHDVADGARVYGSPQMEERAWHKVTAALKRLPELLQRVRRLERAQEERESDAGDASASEGDSERSE